MFFKISSFVIYKLLHITKAALTLQVLKTNSDLSTVSDFSEDKRLLKVTHIWYVWQNNPG